MGYKWTVLVGKERSCGSWMASTVPHKKGEGRFIADKCLEHMSENGDQVGKIVIKGDQERSIAYMLDQIVEMRENLRTTIEESPVQSKGSQRVAERAVQEKERGIGSTYLALRSRVGGQLDARERIEAFMPGLTAHERVKGKKPMVTGIEFGERYCLRSMPARA